MAQAHFDDLRTAIWATTPATGWEPVDVNLRFDLVQGCLVRWVDDIERIIKKAAAALDRASVDGATERGADELETGLMYEVAAREKLVALLALFLSVPSLDPYKDGIRFFPRENRVRNELMKRATDGTKAAGALLQGLIEFDNLPAIGLRNQLAHGISFLPTVTEICWFRIETLGFITGEPVGGEMSHLLPEGMLDQPDLTAQTLFDWVESSAQDALSALEKLVELTEQFVTATAELAPVNAVYRIPGQAGVVTELPEPGQKTP